MALRCDTSLKRGEKKKVRPKVGSNRWSIASKKTWLVIYLCATGADNTIGSAVLLVVLPVPWLTDVWSNQRWVIYSQTNGAVSKPTYFRFVWFVVVFLTCLFVFEFVIVFYDLLFVFEFVIVFSDLLFCFRICHVFSELLFCFLYLHLRCNLYFVFRIVFCFALVGHRTIFKQIHHSVSTWCLKVTGMMKQYWEIWFAFNNPATIAWLEGARRGPEWFMEAGSICSQ